MKLILIRHGKTKGNLEKRYIGTTDESLCPEGITELLEKKPSYPQTCDHLFVSPLLRCRETAELLFPGKERTIVEDLKECDFGAFENKNYMELTGNEDYQRWIDSNGTMPFPGGESQESFQRRCVDAFLSVFQSGCIKEEDTVVFVVHGGTIMSIMDYLNTDPSKSYYDFQIKNGESFVFEHTIAF